MEFLLVIYAVFLVYIIYHYKEGHKQRMRLLYQLNDLRRKQISDKNLEAVLRKQFDSLIPKWDK